MKRRKAVNPFEESAAWEPADLDGRVNAPQQGRRCLFELKSGWRAFGYRYADGEIYLPLTKQRVSMMLISRWMYVEGDLYWNGSGRQCGAGY